MNALRSDGLPVLSEEIRDLAGAFATAGGEKSRNMADRLNLLADMAKLQEEELVEWRLLGERIAAGQSLLLEQMPATGGVQ